MVNHPGGSHQQSSRIIISVSSHNTLFIYLFTKMRCQQYSEEIITVQHAGQSGGCTALISALN